MKRASVILCALCALCALNASGAPQIIGSEARLDLPTGWEYSGVVAWKPGTNEVCNLNPPRMSWSYAPDPTTEMPVGLSYLGKLREFRLQVSSNADYSLPWVDLRTRFNFYNFLPCFTNTDGSTWTNRIYWRVDYYWPTNLATPHASFSNTFSISPTATNWDRSLWQDTNYWVSLSNHPRLWFNPSTRSSLSNNIVTNNVCSVGRQAVVNGSNAVRNVAFDCDYEVQISTNNFTTTNSAFRSATNWITFQTAGTPQYSRFRYIYGDGSTNATWNANAAVVAGLATNTAWMPTDMEPWYLFVGSLMNAGWSWQMTRHDFYTNTAKVVQKMFRYVVWSEVIFSDFSASPWQGYSIHYAIDWTFDLLNADQTALVVADADYMLGNKKAFYNDAFCNLLDWFIVGRTNSSSVHHETPFFEMNSHGVSWLITYWPLALALQDRSTNAFRSAQFFTHYAIGVGNMYWNDGGNNSSRGYGGDSYLQKARTLAFQMMSDTVFTNIGFRQNQEYWLNLADWGIRYAPTYHRIFSDPYGQNPYNGHGVPGQSADPDEMFGNAHYGRLLSHFTGHGAVYRAYLQAKSGLSESKDDGYYPVIEYQRPESVEIALTEWLYPRPAQSDFTNRSRMFKSGWVFAESRNPTDYGAFTNGVGLVFVCRPSGRYNLHAALVDFNYDIWAYGANVTDSGVAWDPSNSSDMPSRVPELRNSLFINGRGPHQDSFYWGPRVDNYARIIAYTNGSNFVYCAGEGSQLWPHYAIGAPGNGYTDWSQPGFRMDYITNVERHILFMRDKYFVIFDRAGGTTNLDFAEPYHIRNGGANIDTNAFAWNYLATNRTPGLPVTVYVQHVATNGLKCINLSGSLARKNPFTGTNFPADAYDPGRSNAVWTWVSGTNTHQMFIIYPVKSGDTTPTITRVDEWTVAVTNNGNGDVISFDTNNPSSKTLIVDTQSPLPTTIPTFSPPAGSYSYPQDIMVSGESGSYIFWTNQTTLESGNFSSGNVIHLSAPSVIRAYATNAGKLNSAWSDWQTYTGVGQVNTPVIAPDSQLFTNSLTFSISCSTPGATNLYTVDGTLATTNSFIYSVPMPTTQTITVHAVATKSNMVQSAQAVARTYTRYSPDTTTRPNARTGVLRVDGAMR